MRQFLIAASLLTLGLAACNKDDDGSGTPDPDKSILGKWALTHDTRTMVDGGDSSYVFQTYFGTSGDSIIFRDDKTALIYASSKLASTSRYRLVGSTDLYFDDTVHYEVTKLTPDEFEYIYRDTPGYYYEYRANYGRTRF